jgi:hypothetical protein
MSRECTSQFDNEDRYRGGWLFFNDKVKKKIASKFANLTDQEVICYTTCELYGWSYRRLAKQIRISTPTIKDRVLVAKEKRSKDEI